MSEVFPKAIWPKKGYTQNEVDSFFERARAAYEGGMPAEQFSSPEVRAVRFSMVRGGYATEVVDGALDRLEAAFVKRDRADHVAVNGQQAWLDRVASRATTLYPRLLRPAGERFDHPASGKGYDAEQVDQFLDRIASFFDDGEVLTADQIRGVTFKHARGTKAYEEGVVDAYLNRAIEILLSVE